MNEGRVKSYGPKIFWIPFFAPIENMRNLLP